MIRLKNNTGGWYSLKLDDSTGIKPARTFTFLNENTELTIPADYAASIMTDPYATYAYKAGMFSVIGGAEELEKLAVESGAATAEEVKTINQNIVPDAMLIAALKNGKLAKVEEYINSPNLERLTQLAIDNLKSISQEKIDAIEKATGVSLSVEGE